MCHGAARRTGAAAAATSLGGWGCAARACPLAVVAGRRAPAGARQLRARFANAWFARARFVGAAIAANPKLPNPRGEPDASLHYEYRVRWKI